MRYTLICEVCPAVETAADSDTNTNKDQITAFRRRHQSCGAVKILPETTG